MKIEIGGQRNMSGWYELNNRKDESGPNFNIITDDLSDQGVNDESVEYFYMSHVIEHIPIVCAESVFKKLYRKLKKGGKVRIVCPDLDFIIKCFLENNTMVFNNPNYHLGTVPEYYQKLGIGGYFMSQLTTGCFEDNDSYLFTDRINGKYICTFSHIAGWNYEMLSNLLKIVGFHSVERTDLEEIDPHKTFGQLCLNAYK